MREGLTRLCLLGSAALLVLSISSCWAGEGPSLSAAAPSPAGWDQWQPQTDSSDGRLETVRVSIWEQQIPLMELLATLSEQSGVELAAVEPVSRMHVAVFVKDRGLSGIMSALAELFEGYWCSPRGQAPDARQYCLVPHSRHTEPFDMWLEGYSRSLERAVAASHRSERERRMALYEKALSLSPEKLLELYETSDPWICADLLHPAVGPMVRYTCSLPERQKEQLLAEGGLALSLRGMDAEFRSHLGHWSKGDWGMPAGQMAGPDPDRLPRFTTPEDRWDNAHVELYWTDLGLKLMLRIPDGVAFDAHVMRHPDATTVAIAREQIASLGYREDTPEYREAVRREAEEWQETTPPDDSPEGLAYSSLCSAPNQTDARLSTPIAFDEAVGREVLVSEVLEQVARETELGVVAPYLPPSCVALRWPPPEQGAEEAGQHPAPGAMLSGAGQDEDSRRPSLGGALSYIRRQRGGLFSWNFHGQYLVGVDAEHRLLEESRLPSSVLAEWEERLKSGGSFPLGDFARLLASLNDAQISELYSAPGLAGHMQFLNLPLSALRLYGLLTPDQQSLLAESEGLPLASIPRDRRFYYERVAQRSHPWVESGALENAVLRTLPRRVSTGEEGISFVLEYHLPDSPNDREVLFTCPLQITLGARGERPY